MRIKSSPKGMLTCFSTHSFDMTPLELNDKERMGCGRKHGFIKYTHNRAPSATSSKSAADMPNFFAIILQCIFVRHTPCRKLCQELFEGSILF